MTLKVASNINALLYPTTSTTENAILAQVFEVLQELREEVQQLRDDRDRDQAEIQALRTEVRALQKSQDQGYEALALNIARDRQRLTALEHPKEEPKAYTSKVATHLDATYEALKAREKACEDRAQKIDFMSFWEVEQLLDLSHRRISQLAEIAANDPRFIIAWHPKKNNRKVFRINPFTQGNLACEPQKRVKA
jgi:uncharacterized coiled-coil DUF342 family protein